MYYAALESLALLIVLIENNDIFFKRRGMMDTPSRSAYRLFLFAVLFYYITDILWGLIESRQMGALLFADTTAYFISMAAGVVLWTRAAITYLGERNRFGSFLVYAGRVLACIVAAFTVANIFTPVLFVVDKPCVYRALGARYVVLVMQILLLLMVSVFAVVTVIRRHIAPDRRKKYRTLGAFGAIMAIFLTVQLWFPNLPLYGVAYLLGTSLVRAFIIADEKEEYLLELRQAQKVVELKQSLTALMNNIPGMSFSKDSETGVYLACNQAFAEYAHKKNPEGVVGLTDAEIFDAETAAHFTADDRIALSMDGPYVFVEDVPDAAGNPKHIQTTKLKFIDGQGRVCLLGLCQDMTEQMMQRQEAERLQEERIAYSRINALTGDVLCLYIIDPEDGSYREYSTTPGIEEVALPKTGPDFFGVAREYGRRLIYPDDLDRFLSLFTMENALAELEHSAIYSLRSRLILNGKPRYVRFKFALLDEKEGRRMIFGIHDIDAVVRQEQEYAKSLAQAQTKASVDALTGVRNRHAFLEAEEDIDRQIEQRLAPHFAIVMFDVNGLKTVNDTKGHAAGDELIREACKVICDIFDHSPVFRLGGDEFAVIAQGRDYENIDELIGKVSDHNEEALGNGGAVVACGMARFDDDDCTADVFARADHEMYENKARLKGERD